jgi:uncharacterized protein involved in exopolysaccharide biosynthesis
MTRDPNQHMERNPTGEDDGEGDGIDLERIKEIVGFVLRAPRRRPFLAAAVFIVGASLGILAAATMPRTYNSQVKLLAQTNIVGPLSDPDRRVPNDNPTKDLGDKILRRENMTALVKETNLVDRYYAARSPTLKFKDKLMGGTGTADDRLQIVVATLEKNLSVTVENNNVTLAVDWYEPELAYTLVTTVQKNFQAAQYDDDVAMISEAITVLQDHAKVEADAVDAALEEYRKLILAPAVAAGNAGGGAGAGPRVARPAFPRAGSPAAAASAPDPDLAEELEDKRQEIRSLEAQRQRELETLRGQLAQAELTLTAQHPTVIALQQKIDTLTTPDPHLAQLKADERALMASIAPPPPRPANPQGQAPSSLLGSDPPPQAPVPPPIVSTLGTVKEDPQAQVVRTKIGDAIRRYEEVVWRIDSVKYELDIARAAFKHRFTVVTPAEVPRKPKKAIGTTVGVGSVVGSLVLALLLAAVADLMSGRILEEWQVRRQLKLEVLGEFDPTTSLPSGPT